MSSPNVQTQLHQAGGSGDSLGNRALGQRNSGLPHFALLSLITPLLLPKVSVPEAAGTVGRASQHQQCVPVPDTAHPGTVGLDAAASGDLQLRPGSVPSPALPAHPGLPRERGWGRQKGSPGGAMKD